MNVTHLGPVSHQHFCTIVQGSEEADAGSSPSREVASLQADFFSLLQNHLANKVDSNQFEDSCRAMLGANSYVLFTIQKLVTKILRSVQHIVTVCLPSPVIHSFLAAHGQHT
jgi:paired amphipathic helix protein Sin3a